MKLVVDGHSDRILGTQGGELMEKVKPIDSFAKGAG
jgi:hypothetical protein